nr:uncharacterized protein LOC121118177 [Lepeophtheirus salmonis]
MEIIQTRAFFFKILPPSKVIGEKIAKETEKKKDEYKLQHTHQTKVVDDVTLFNVMVWSRYRLLRRDPMNKYFTQWISSPLMERSFSMQVPLHIKIFHEIIVFLDIRTKEFHKTTE